MDVQVIVLPHLLRQAQVLKRAVVVLDVLRATTTMAAALDAGAREIRVFGSIAEVRAAAAPERHALLLCGEENCLRPQGFDMGNSPLEFTADRCAGRTIFMSTTNGTRALLAARGAARLYAAALVNASATARRLAEQGADVSLLCAGTGPEVSMEDLIGAGAILSRLDRLTSIKLASDPARIALHLFNSSVHKLPETLRQTAGGRNVIAAGLEADIDFAARVDALDLAAEVDPQTLTAVKT